MGLLIKGRHLDQRCLYKLTNKEEIHNGLQFKTGDNYDILPFYPSGECKPGGIYFVDIREFFKYKSYGILPSDRIYWIRKVSVDDDEDVWDEGTGKFKARHIKLGERILFNDFKITDKEMAKEIIRNSPSAIQYVSDECLDEDMCLDAVKRDGLALRYVKRQTWDICLEAVRQNGMALVFVGIQGWEEMVLDAINEKPIQFIVSDYDIRLEDRNICLEAVRQNGMALEYVESQDAEICLEAVKQNPMALEYVKSEYKNICEEFLKTK